MSIKGRGQLLGIYFYCFYSLKRDSIGPPLHVVGEAMKCQHSQVQNPAVIKFCVEYGHHLTSSPNSQSAKELSLDEKLAKLQKSLPGAGGFSRVWEVFVFKEVLP